ncbi:Nramp family divalent metal transporter [Aureimonas pseudogalii]|uniref:Putative tellurium resistance membrane protein TerC n=1 Tax=Aureimonas pseudogalii TaxID=1744844 RepID=A0A7W6H6R7_9HYPH|nr:Nramp family divalent metal transporter [Aureimonas pseudogalii]MBB3999620.1 putative tellurium resistance membrane protein TerC [Aureimonas pseudogalii]
MSTVRDDRGGSAADLFPAGRLGRPEVRELPAAPAKTGRLIGPGIVAAGVGLSSGEFILYPYIASQVGMAFVWAALLGVTTQFFLNMEIERYTLATGETVLTGFSRFWPHWGLVFAVMTCFANLWPGWVTSSATMLSYIVGGEPRWIAVGMLVAIGLILTLAPVVYVILERLQMVKVAAVGLLIVIAAFFVITAEDWAALPQIATTATVPTELGFALLLGALAFAGAGGGQNLCQSNWIRDKGFGMGKYVPRITSPVTGAPEAAPSTGFVFEPTAENMARWRRWWHFANFEQLVTFVLITFVTITFTSLLAYATVYGEEGLANSVAFVQREGQVLSERVGSWFGILFWFIGAFSLFGAATGIVDYTARLVADVLRTSYLKGQNESRLYFVTVWTLVTIGIVVLFAGLAQPLVLLVISACVGGLMMFLYSFLLIRLNRTFLVPQLRPGALRVGTLIWAFLLFGILSGITVVQQAPKLWGAG